VRCNDEVAARSRFERDRRTFYETIKAKYFLTKSFKKILNTLIQLGEQDQEDQNSNPPLVAERSIGYSLPAFCLSRTEKHKM